MSDESRNPLKKIAQAAKLLADDEETPVESDWLASAATEEPLEGQLAIDVYQTADDVVIKAPIAGVKPEHLDIAVTDETVTIKGERKDEMTEAHRDYFSQECYWGAFSRVYQLPVAVNAERAQAVLKDGILTVTLPKIERLRTKVVKVEAA